MQKDVLILRTGIIEYLGHDVCNIPSNGSPEN